MAIITFAIGILMTISCLFIRILSTTYLAGFHPIYFVFAISAISLAVSAVDTDTPYHGLRIASIILNFIPLLISIFGLVVAYH